ncbi:MmgE/PrpD family protein [Billgrantia aerodenitrificans]|uniref:MmgE/PrpD family protein n=1 Tax=Billgrantia aerodenitrificans TaxID=2733483 RepID=A0ABS9ARV2_9GAMM|nr:MmgE/PrpD family protein [Halomonas aerodenitrificans]MCE8024366.1 MmgE/PrpD family protein [Halomonas aerodenitrificans]
MTTETNITQDAVQFIQNVTFADLPAEALEIGKRCMLDTMGLYAAGATEHSVHILMEEAVYQGGREDALLLAGEGQRVPTPAAARILGTSGHAHDWDDTQVSHDPRHVYGLLTHPSVPPLTAALVVAQQLGGVSGEALMLAFQTGVEVESKISEWMLPDHYRRGHHTSGTVGTFGACAAAAKLLQLTDDQVANALGIAASFAAGIRCNFGTMTKPLHVGRAAENGVTAAMLAKRGFTADPTALDGRWGFLQVLGGGYSEEKLSQGFGKTFTIVSPGVSIKPYPSGIVTHQSMDAMRNLVLEHDIQPEQVDKIDFYAANNILEPIRYPIAKNHLQAKFCMNALLAMLVLRRQAGAKEFTDEFVSSDPMQDMQKRISLHLDPEIEAMGFDRIRSRIVLQTKDGKTFEKWADERYRGGPSNPMTNGEVEEKFRVCAQGLLDEESQKALIASIWAVDTLADSAALTDWMANVASEA